MTPDTDQDIRDKFVVSWLCHLNHEAEAVVLMSLLKQHLGHLHAKVCPEHSKHGSIIHFHSLTNRPSGTKVRGAIEMEQLQNDNKH